MKYYVNFREGKIIVMYDEKEYSYVAGEIMCQTALRESEAVDCLIEKEDRETMRRMAMQYLIMYYGKGKDEYSVWKMNEALRWALMISPELVKWYNKCNDETEAHLFFETEQYVYVILADLLFAIREKTRISQCDKCSKFFVNSTNATDCGCNLSDEEIEFKKEVDKMLARRVEIDKKIRNLVRQLYDKPICFKRDEKHRYYLSYRSRLLNILERGRKGELTLEEIHKEFDKVEEELQLNKGGNESDKIV